MRVGIPLARRSKYNAARNHPPQGAANISLTTATGKVRGRPVLQSRAGKDFKPLSGVGYPVVSNTLQEITSEVRFNSGVKATTPLNLGFGFSNNGDITSDALFGVTLDISATISKKGSPEEPVKIFNDAPKSSNEVSQITLSYKSPQAASFQQPAFRNADGFAMNVSALREFDVVSPANQCLVFIPELILQGGVTLIIQAQITFQSSLTSGVLTQNVKWTLNVLPQDDGEAGEEEEGKGGKGGKPLIPPLS